MNFRLSAVCFTIMLATASAVAGAQTTPVAVPVPFATVGAGTGTASTSTCTTGVLSTGGATLGDGCAPATAGLNAPQGVSVDHYGNMYIADYNDRAVRVVYNGGAALAAAITAANSGYVISATRNAPATVPVVGNVYTLAGSGTQSPAAITAVSGAFPCANYSTGGQPVALNSLGDGCPGAAAFVGPRAVAPDADGNVFIADYTNSRVRVLCVNCATGTTAAQLVALENPEVTAVNGAIYTLAGFAGGYRDGYIGFGGATAAASAVSLLRSPTGISVSAADDIYVADDSNNAVRLLYNGGAAALALLTAEGYTPTRGYVYTIAGAGCVSAATTKTGSVTSANSCLTLTSTDGVLGNASGVNTPWSIYLDPNSNVYISDSGNSRVRVIYGGIANPLTLTGALTVGDIYTFAVGGASTANGIAPSNLLFAATAAQGVGGDGSGNIFMTDYLRNVVMEVYAQTGTLTTIAGGSNPVSGGVCNGLTTGPLSANAFGDGCPATQSKLNAPRGSVVADLAGNLYFGDSSDSIVQRYAYGVAFPPTPVGATSAAQPYAFTFNSAATLSATSPVTFTLLDAPTTEFASAGAAAPDTCSAALVATQNSTCVVNVVSSPQKPGVRLGAINLHGATGTVLAAENVSGTGVGAGLNVDPGAMSSVGSGLSAAGIAIDGQGQVFVSDLTSKRVVVYPSVTSASGSAAITGLNAPAGIAIDGAGNVFVADSAANTITELPAGGTAFTAVGTGLKAPHGLAVDATGSLLIADTGNNRIASLAPNGKLAATLAITGLNAPQGVAVDPAGNIYVADTGNSRIVKFVPSTQTQTVFANVASSGVAVDAAGDVVAFSGTTLNLYPAAGGAPIAMATGLITPRAVALDAAGNAYVADSGAAGVLFDQRTRGAFTFTVSPSSTTFTLTSTGNAALTLGSPLFANSNATNFGAASATTNGCSGSLAAGMSCGVTASFQSSSAGNFSGTITFSTNATNASPIKLALSGTTTATLTTTMLTTSATSGNYGTSFTLTATVASSGGVPPGSVTFYNGSAVLGTATVGTNGFAAVTLVLPAGALSVTASYTPTGTTFAASTSAAQTITVTPGNLVVTATSVTRGYGQTNTALTYTITGYVNGETAATATTGAPLETTSATASSSQGSYPITITQGTLAAPNYTLTFVNGTLTITQARPTITVAANPTTAFAGSAVVLTATIVTTAGTPTGSVTFFSGSTSLGSATVNGTTATLSTTALATGTDSITAVYGGDTNFSTATSAAIAVTILPGFGVSSSSTTLTMPHGYQEAQATLTINPGGRTATLTFACAGLPANLSCAFNPATLALSGLTTPQSVTLLVSNSNATAEVAPVGGSARNGVLFAALPAALLLMWSMRRRKMLPRLLAFLLLAGGLSTMLTGCGSTVPTQNAGSYSFTVTVSSSATTLQTLNFTVNVQ